ncbi:MAG: OB-fold nucleic acid binding domain-containing protein [Asgard group archaeon]|nr:OB-fold nucleic acid binding domain-containing protein [Asgard group archaeon]
MSFIKVENLKPVKKPGINIRVRVIAKGQPRTVKTKYGHSRVCDVKVADETGTVNLSLWGSKISEVSYGDLLEIKEGYNNVWQGRPQLSLGRNGTMEKIEDEDFPDAKELLQMFIEENQ